MHILYRLRRAILPVLGYWAVLLAFSTKAEIPGLQVPSFVLPGLVVAGLPIIALASILIFHVAHESGSDLALRDELTGLGNRRAFVAQAQALLKEAPPGKIGLVLIDVDGLKFINDACGHQAGDELLEHVTRRAEAKKQKLYRIGGDEFAVLIDRSKGQQLTETMKSLEPFSAAFESCGHTHEVRVSCGSSSNRAGEKFEELFRRADDNLRRHKRLLYSSGWMPDNPAAEDDPAADAPPVRRLRLLS
ncbi:MAG TPA: GGDEF domain-containing protein [Dehalococcoidia bacterium]|nr:GGDEF domain-containing protein [Dehalococcoidia bacterium]